MAGLRILVRCNSGAPKVVREALERLPEAEQARDDALLVASELVTNAVRHSQCTHQQELTVCATCHNERLRISVLDPGVSGRAAAVAEPRLEPGGLGLRVVDQLSESWGSERSPDGYEVWAEVSLAA